MADTFDGPESGFDKVLQETNGGITTNTYDAWFYMLESRQTPKKAIPMTCPDAGWEDYDSEKTNYNPYFERARQTKELGSGPLSPGYGTNVVDANGDRDFVYANKLSPYMLIKCSIAMDLVDDAAGQELGGDVTYIIPLGDAGTSATPTEAKVNNFNTNRNTFYHYTITVNGVHNIRVEVDARQTELSSDENFQMEENQPGAMGQVVVAKEEIAICDCHYVSKTITFHAKNVSQNLTWHVNTPFGEGGPEVDIDGNDIIPPGLDYEWVHFRVNQKTSSGAYYSDQRRAYTNAPYDPETNPDGIMNVSQLVKYMKQQKAIYDTEDPAAPETWSSDFDNGMMVTYDAEGNVSGEVSDPEGRKICVTAFVNEFYYDYNPLNPLEPIPADFWKQYVNWPTDRYMYILSESNLSRDQESRATGSVVTIQQHPIQSIYDTTPSNTTFSTAWGLEQTDEFADKWPYWSSTRGGSRGNTSKDNGRLNTMKEWELVNSGGTTYTPANWDTYMDFEVRNDLPQLHEEYQYLRYSCMTRNRDNDGDGVIDHDEVRWYMAALNQLFGMTIGSDVINFESRLYNRTPATEALYGYRQHVASSTASGSSASNNPTVLWAEQLSSTSSMTNSQSWTNKGVAANKVTKWTIRCLRNLGTTAETIANPTSTDLQELPEDYIAIDEGNLSITCVRLNPKVLRAQQEQELVFSDEYSEQCRLPKRFYIAPSQVASLPSVSGYDLGHEVLNRNQQIEDVGSSVDAGYCPEGYRMPNLRELTMMANYFPDYVNSGAFCRTYYSLGILGSQKDVDVNNDDGDKAGWTARNSGGEAYVQMVPGGYGTIGVPRCVRDASVEELQAEGLL